MTAPHVARAFAAALAVVIVLTIALAGAAAQTPGLHLLANGLAGWEERSFDGHTAYTLQSVGGEPVLRAEARGTASGLYRERPVALDAWPVLRWSWRADTLPGAGDERARSGDDFALRVYVVASDPVFFWRTRAVCYVWSAGARRGGSWRSPFTDNVRMLALRGPGDAPGEWRDERRDVAADFRRLFGDAPATIDAVAVMTDGDQTGGVARGAYRGLRFEAPTGG